MFDSKLNSLLVLSVTNSITKTAEVVHMTQPSITAQIKSIEKELGIKIFVKEGNNIIITPEGNLVIEYAKKVKEQYNILLKGLQTLKTDIKIIKVGVTSGMGSTFISSVLANYSVDQRMNNENFRLVLIYDSYTKLLSKLNSKEIVCIITDERIKDDSLKKLKLDEGKLVCVASNNHEIANRDSITLEELRNYDLLIRLANSRTQILFDAILKTRNLSIEDFKILMELNSISAIKNLVKKNYALAIIPDSTCIYEIQNKELVVIPLSDVDTSHTFNIYYKDDMKLNKIIYSIRDYYLSEKEKTKISEQ